MGWAQHRHGESRCPVCGRYFDRLGLASHRARCRERQRGGFRRYTAAQLRQAKEQDQRVEFEDQQGRLWHSSATHSGYAIRASDDGQGVPGSYRTCSALSKLWLRKMEQAQASTAARPTEVRQ